MKYFMKQLNLYFKPNYHLNIFSMRSRMYTSTKTSTLINEYVSNLFMKNFLYFFSMLDVAELGLIWCTGLSW